MRPVQTLDFRRMPKSANTHTPVEEITPLSIIPFPFNRLPSLCAAGFVFSARTLSLRKAVPSLWGVFRSEPTDV